MNEYSFLANIEAVEHAAFKIMCSAFYFYCIFQLVVVHLHLGHIIKRLIRILRRILQQVDSDIHVTN